MDSKCKKIADIIMSAKKVAFFHHKNPDWDAMSSSYSLAEGIKHTYPEKEVKWIGDKDSLKRSYYNLINEENASDQIDEDFLAVVGDVSSLERIFLSDEFKKAKHKVCFDHHLNEIDFEADEFWIDSTLGASSIQAFEIAKELKIDFTPRIALLFLAGIITDTGHLMYSLNDPRPAQAMAELLAMCDKEELRQFYRDIKTKTKKDIEIEAHILANMKIEDGIAYVIMNAQDYKKLDIEEVSAKQFVNRMANIEGAEIWAMFQEEVEDKQIKVSIRSLGANVNEVAKKYGGGGHKQASGIKFDIDWEMPKKIISDLKIAAAEYIK